MSTSIDIIMRDETFAGKVVREVKVSFPSASTTIREVIENRVRQEVRYYNARRPEYYNGLVDPGDAEKTINGFKVLNRKQIDEEKQVYVALDAFQKNGYFVLVDTIQSDSLDQPVQLKPDTLISFIKLTPLVGG